MLTECERIKVLLGAYMDGECTAEERTAAEAHLRVCADCAKYRDELAANARWVAATRETFPATLHASIMRAVAVEQAKAPRKAFPYRALASGLAACLAIAVLAGASWRYLLPRDEGLDVSNMSYTASDPAVYLLYLQADGSWATVATDRAQAVLTLRGENAALTEGENVWQGRAVYAENGMPQRLIFDGKTYAVTCDEQGNMTVRAED